MAEICKVPTPTIDKCVGRRLGGVPPRSGLPAAACKLGHPAHPPWLPLLPLPPPCRVILWAQEKIGKSYLVDGKLTGADIADSGAPQRWGIKRPADLLMYVPADVVVTNMEALASAASNAFGPASEALLAQLGSLALPSLAEEEEEEGGNGGGAAAASKLKPAAYVSRSSLLASRVSQTLVSLGSQRLCMP